MTGFVYVIQGLVGGPLKIGHSEDPDRRLAALQTSHHQELAVTWRCYGSRDIEARLHDRLSDKRIRGEWFEDCAEVQAALADARSWSHEELITRAHGELQRELRQLFNSALTPIVAQLMSEMGDLEENWQGDDPLELIPSAEVMRPLFSHAGAEIADGIPPLFERVLAGVFA